MSHVTLSEHTHASGVPPVSGGRAWRVGSLSMGITLIMIGTALAASIWQNVAAYELLLWVAPVVFILLGTELLLYLKFSGSGRTIVKYDWVSVFFVGIFGAASLVLALLMSTGVFDELQRGLNTMQRTAFVSTSKVQVPPNIERLVVQSMSGIDIEPADSSDLQLVGQIRYWSADQLKQSDDKWLSTTITGNTMYVWIGAMDRKDSGFVADQVDPRLTLIVPAGVEVVQK